MAESSNRPQRSSGDRPRRPYRPYSRTDHRARSHESAHAADTDSGPAPHGPDHPLVPRGRATLVADDAQLADLVNRLRAAGSFAYDSEFIGELTYFPKLCLIQVATTEEVALIDPLSGPLELRPFWELICDPAVEKIVHAGQQDLEPIVRHLDRQPANVFDTQVAAGFAALPYPVSLSKLIQELTGVRIGKGLTFTHWDQRPLSEMQLRYAADDVRFLPRARDELRRRLDALGHAQWAAEECAALCDVALYRFDPDAQYLKIRGASGLDPRNLSVLRELTAWRDSAAREHDVPPRSFLKDEILLDMARSPVKTVEKLDRVRGLPRPVEHDYGAHIVELTNRAWGQPVDNLPAGREYDPSPTERFRSDALWAAAQCVCIGQGVDPSVATSRAEMGEFFRLMDAGQDLSNLRLMRGWRREALGEPLVRLVGGSGQMSMRWADGSLRLKGGA